MLGARMRDPAGVDGDADGLGLLPLDTRFAAAKLTAPATTRFRALGEPWSALGELPVRGYEIRHGRTSAASPVRAALPDGRGWVAGPVLGVTLHGLFEEPAAVAALVGAEPSRSLDDVLDELTDAVMPALDVERIEAAAGR
jgi:adenosylcobyric acid synthase